MTVRDDDEGAGDKGESKTGKRDDGSMDSKRTRKTMTKERRRRRR
jgi:hypothetical protein